MRAVEIERAFAEFGVPLKYRLNVATIRGQADLDAVVDRAKADAMASFRRQVLRAHPDAGGSEAETQALLAARDVVKRVRLRMPRPVRQPQVVVQVFRWRGNATTATSQTSVWF